MADISGSEVYPGNAVREAQESLRAVVADESRRLAGSYVGALIVVPVTSCNANPTPYEAIPHILTAAENEPGSLFIPETTNLVISGIKRARFIDTRKSAKTVHDIRRVQGMFFQFAAAREYSGLHTQPDFLSERHTDVGSLTRRLDQYEEVLMGDYLGHPHFCHIALTDPAHLPGLGINADNRSAYMLKTVELRRLSLALEPTWVALAES